MQFAKPFGKEAGSYDREAILSLFAGVDRVQIVACGTSYYAGLTSQYLISELARIAVDIDVASEFRYRDPVLSQKTVALFISQSGETADTLASLRLATKMGLKTISLVNSQGSTIDRESQYRLYLNAGPEIGVASTKAFSATLMVLSALALDLAQARKTQTPERVKTLVNALLHAPSLVEALLNYDEFFSDVAEKFMNYKGLLYMGRGTSFPIALEGALKLKELAYMHAEGYPAGEMKHGPLALIDDQMLIVVLAPQDQWYEKTISNLEEVKARGGHIIAIGSQGDERLKDVGQYHLTLPQTDPLIHPLLLVVPLQLLAYHVALRLGHDVDQPRNLAKSVTVE